MTHRPTDAMVLAEARRLAEDWDHAPDCAVHDNPGASCTCGLQDLLDVLYGRSWPDPPKREGGWKPGKFVVKHYRRGDLMDGEAFALVPERDPAAIPALLAYAAATPDHLLAAYLRAWIDRIEPEIKAAIAATDPISIYSWAASLSEDVHAGRLSLDTALLRIATLTREAMNADRP